MVNVCWAHFLFTGGLMEKKQQKKTCLSTLIRLWLELFFSKHANLKSSWVNVHFPVIFKKNSQLHFNFNLLIFYYSNRWRISVLFIVKIIQSWSLSALAWRIISFVFHIVLSIYPFPGGGARRNKLKKIKSHRYRHSWESSAWHTSSNFPRSSFYD